MNKKALFKVTKKITILISLLALHATMSYYLAVNLPHDVIFGDDTPSSILGDSFINFCLLIPGIYSFVYVKFLLVKKVIKLIQDEYKKECGVLK